ncbi:uncharacterized protein LOC128388972 isoform X2 [Panonychus citri]|uniref:uncharacterized protein LOC128388972 isoform X2 n=1 Tax=Panonychus citri TaxID=50023 RepID=UPI002307B9F7|nr:uncharacterized protein LOC128388972 isoform X2 [Panonychus citri]
MSLSDLPDICLLKIFENVHEAKELIQLSKVCSRWSDLITPRFKRVKYLHLMDASDAVDYIDVNSLWINPDTKWNYDNLFELFSNIKIIDTAAFDYHGSYNLPEIVKNNPQIKGLIGYFDLKREDYDLSDIEMFVAEFNFDYKKVFRPDHLKQVSCYYFFTDDLPSFIEYFPNLKRLHLKLCGADGVFYNGPNLSALKILELCTSDYIEQEFTGFHFMDFCPSLESAFFRCWARDIYVDESIKNYNLRDLVIEKAGFYCVAIDNAGRLSWPLLKKLLSKFPNLHHLAIRNFDELDVSNFDLEKLIKLLPELKILDLRKCKNVTQKSADFLSKYCVKENRSIVLYYSCKNEPTEWPKLVETREPICYGFDFMKHCFYKSAFNRLPDLIDE